VARRRPPAQAIIVELVGGEVPKDVGACPVSPGREIDQGGRLAQACGQQKAEDLTVGKLELGIGRRMAVDDAGDVELIEQRWINAKGPRLTTSSARAAPCQRRVMAPP
jgi:hypothetical protein